MNARPYTSCRALPRTHQLLVRSWKLRSLRESRVGPEQNWSNFVSISGDICDLATCAGPAMTSSTFCTVLLCGRITSFMKIAINGLGVCELALRCYVGAE